MWLLEGRVCVCVGCAAGSHGVHVEINHNSVDDDYDWYFGSSCVLDGGSQPLYRGGGGVAQLTAGTCRTDAETTRCCPRRQHSAPGAITGAVTEPCQ